MSNTAVSNQSVSSSKPIHTLTRQEERALLVSILPRQGRRLGNKSLVVEIQAGDLSYNPPLFTFGSWWEEVAWHLDPRQAVYGMPVLAEAQNPETHVQALASLYLQEIRTIQPHGPYLLGGYCFGGWVAFEIAQQLQALGEEVRLLALVQRSGPDPIYRRYQPTVDRWQRQYRQLASRLQTHLQQLSQFSLAKRFQYIGDLVMRVGKRGVIKPSNSNAVKRKRQSNAAEGSSSTFEQEQRAQVLESLDLAMDQYTPNSYSGRVALFFGLEGGMYSFVFPKGGWGKFLTGPSELYVLSGGHHTLLKEPYSRALAAQLKNSIDRAKSQSR